jgi:hypothetical protein
MTRKLPSTPNFEIKELQDLTRVFVGIDKNSLNNFIESAQKKCIVGKIYRISVIEEAASPAQRAFLFIVYDAILTHLNVLFPTQWEMTKESELELRMFFENGLLNLAKNQSDIYPYSRWVLPIRSMQNPDEVLKEILYPCSSWTSGQMNEYLGYLETVCHETFEDFIFPDPTTFKGERKNARLYVEHPEKQFIFKR